MLQVLPLVPPGRKANEEGSPYSGQVIMLFNGGVGYDVSKCSIRFLTYFSLHIVFEM